MNDDDNKLRSERPNDENKLRSEEVSEDNENEATQSDLHNIYMDHNQQEIIATYSSNQRPPPYQLHPNVKAGSRSGVNAITSDIK